MEPATRGDCKLNFKKPRIAKNLAVISASIFLLFTAFDGLSLLQSTMNMNQNIGVISQAIIYASFSVAAILLPKYVIQKLGCKQSLLVSMVAYIPYISANFYPAWFIMIPSALLNGVAGSILWGSQSVYFSKSVEMYCTVEEESTQEQALVTDLGNEETYSLKESGCEDDYSKLKYETDHLKHCVQSQHDAELSEEDATSLKQEVAANRFFQNEENMFNEKDKNINSPPINFTEKDENFKEMDDCKRSVQKEHNFNFNEEFEPLTENNVLPVVVGNINRKKENLRSFYSSINSIKNNPQLKYTQNCSERKKMAINKDFVAAFAFGCFGFSTNISRVLSNVMLHYVLKIDSVENSTTNLNCACGAAMCHTETACFNSKIGGITTDVRYLITGICIAFSVTAALLLLLALDTLNDARHREGFSLKYAMATLVHFKKKKQILMVPISVHLGLMLGFYVADFTKFYIGCALGISSVNLVSVAFSLSCGLSSPLSGYMVKHVGRVPIFVFSQITCMVVNVFLILWVPSADETILFYTAAALWGTSTGTMASQTPAFYGILFKEDQEAAFASYYVCFSLGWTLALSSSSLFCTSIKNYILLATSFIGISGYLLTEKSHRQMNNGISLELSVI